MNRDKPIPKCFYKYKGIEHIEHILDILINNRLFCAPPEALNDPMEGYFIKGIPTEEGERDMRELRKFPEYWVNYGVVSLSECNNNYLMWSHYASGFRGLVIGVEVPDEDVEYMDYDTPIASEPVSSLEEWNGVNRRSLLVKHFCWTHEEEWRILKEVDAHELVLGRYCDLSRITTVICGHKMNDAIRIAIGYVCKGLNIKVQKTEISDGQVKIVDA